MSVGLAAGNITARPPRAALLVAASLVLLGVVGAMVALALALLTSALGAAAGSLAGATRVAGGMLAAFTGFSLAGLGCLVLAVHSRATVGTDGRFRVRSWPPGRVRDVNLRSLTRVTSRPGPVRRPSVLLVARRSTVLGLHDRSGGVVEWNPAFWRGHAPVAAALRHAVLASDAEVDAAAAAVLANPPFGNEP